MLRTLCICKTRNFIFNIESIHLFIFRAASKMSSSGPIVSFEVYKHAARYNGLYEWLNNPPQAQVPSSDIHSVIQVGPFSTPFFSKFLLFPIFPPYFYLVGIKYKPTCITIVEEGNPLRHNSSIFTLSFYNRGIITALLHCIVNSIR